jgi:alkanesulfonate monooxygenase SsuD/methylene tetrahydromethanopterin reductase-like flavin-dependent oxidoreductase (luciferase family)
MTLLPFRFGAVAGVKMPGAAWRETVRTAADAGFASLLVPDTLYTMSPFPALAAAAASSDSLQLGTWVLASPLRTPGAVVREAQTVQVLSGGRLELGIGAGRPGGERDAPPLGVEWARPGVRVGQVEAVIEAVLTDVDPAPRIVLAGAGDRMLGIAARHAATLAVATSPTSSLDEVASATDRARAAGFTGELSMQISGVGSDIPEWLSRQGMTAESLRGRPSFLTGDVDEDEASLTALRERTGISYVTFSGEFAARVAPLVQRLTGR